jgi:hypothetical protein
MHKVIAIAAAAVCAAVIVGLIPEPEPAEAASTAEGDSKGACFQNWPYYERSCLHDSRQQDGNARAVRVIAINQPMTRRSSRH